MIDQALLFDPFDGDMGGEFRVLSDKMVRAAKMHCCVHCHQPIQIGERHRAMGSVLDGDFMQHRWCAECCKAMIVDVEHGDWEAFEDRCWTNKDRSDLERLREVTP